MLNRKRQLAFQMLKYKIPEEGVFARLPEAYKNFYKELNETQPKPVHYMTEPGRLKKNPETGIITPVQNVPIPTIFPKQLDNTLLGGEMVIRGFVKKHFKTRRVPRFWLPTLKRSVVYSEILDKHFSAIITDRLILQIHEYQGFDNYLLQNLACDLRTNLALKIKRKILIALLENDLPYDKSKNAEIYEKYKQYIIPREEVEWFGLTKEEACQKQLDLEEAERKSKMVPLKHQLRLQLIQELREAGIKEGQDKVEVASSSGWLTKITRPFASKDS